MISAECIDSWSRGRDGNPKFWLFLDAWQNYEHALELRLALQVPSILRAECERSLLLTRNRLRINEWCAGLGNIRLGDQLGAASPKRICAARACWPKSNQAQKLPLQL